MTVEDRTGSNTILQLIGPKSQSLVSDNGIHFCMHYHWRIEKGTLGTHVFHDSIDRSASATNKKHW